MYCCTYGTADVLPAAHLPQVQLPQDRENRLAHQGPGLHLRPGSSTVSVPVVAKVVVPLNIRNIRGGRRRWHRGERGEGVLM